MFEQVENIMTMSEPTILTVLDTIQSNASFVLFHFSSKFLREKSHVIFVCLENHPRHYSSVHRRLGTSNMESIEYLNALEIVESTQGEIQTLAQDIKLLELEISTRISKCKDTAPVLIIDDLSCLRSLGHSLEDLKKFLFRLDKQVIQNRGTCIRLIHADTYGQDINDDGDDDDGDELRKNMDVTGIVNYAVSQSHLVISTTGLSSGHSKDIDGHVSFARGPRFFLQSSHVMQRFTPRALHYKIMENNVQLIGKGLAKSVI